MSIDIRGSIRMRIGAVGGGGIPIAAEYQALLDEFVVAPSAADQVAQNTFVTTLVDGGVWSELDRMVIPASHASGADSLLDWIHPAVPGNIATLQNMTVSDWAQYQGYLGDGTTKYINLNFAPSLDAVKYSRNSISIGGYTRSEVNTSDVLIGVEGVGKTKCFPRFVGDQFFQVNGAASTGGTIASSLGLHSGRRYSGSSIESYFNGVFTDDSLIAASDLLQGNSFYALATNNNPTPAQFYLGQVSMLYLGGDMDATKILILYNAFQALMTHYGTQV